MLPAITTAANKNHPQPFLSFYARIPARATQITGVTKPDANRIYFIASLYERIPFCKAFVVLTLTVGCSSIFGLIAALCCGPRCNPLTHPLFPVRALSSGGTSGLASHGLTCHCHHYGCLRNFSLLVIYSSVCSLAGHHADMSFIVGPLVMDQRPYCSRYLIRHRHDSNTDGPPFDQLCYPRRWLFAQQGCCSGTMYQ